MQNICKGQAAGKGKVATLLAAAAIALPIERIASLMKRLPSQSAAFGAFFAIATVANAATTIYEATPEELSALARRETVITNIPAQWPQTPDRLWMELWCADLGADDVEIIVNGGKGADGKKRGRFGRRADLPEQGRRGLSTAFGGVKGSLDLAAVSNVTVRTTDGESRRFGVARILLLDAGEEPPAVEEAPRIHARDAAAHHECYVKFKEECRRGAFVLGQASSMENVRPRAAFKWRDAGELSVRLARGERESVQLLVAPAVHDLEDVAVSIVMEGMPPTDFAATNVTVSVVGYVETRDPPPYRIRPKMVDTPRGWWPDPILGFQKSCDISGEDVQSFWIRVTCPTNQFAGTYTGRIRVSASNATTVETRLTIRVNDFEVGRVSPLPLAVQCYDPAVVDWSFDGDSALPKRLKKDPDNYLKAWKTREEKYCDFFADYYLSRDCLWTRPNLPRWDMLVRLRDQGRLGMFNLGYCEPLGLSEASEKDERWQKFLKSLHDRYAKAEELGIADHAYVFMCDELPEYNQPALGRALKVLRREFPNLLFVTTLKDRRLGTDGSSLKEIAHCPPTCFYMSRPVEKARAEGRKVWWYFCNDPASPWANATLEGPPIELRSLMGAQTQKYKPDGFLYWETMCWNSAKPIMEGPFTDWNPKSYGSWHGDGQWTCCGPDLLPLATLRLENFRDGLEDLWYAKLLEEKLREVESSKLKVESEEWIRHAKAALAVPADLVRSTMDFSIDPDVLYRWRDEMADLIEEVIK
jgi:hypothetical protein